jgi:protein-tyrosine phosphatase
LIDLHIHIIPGIDDGPRTLEEALEMARLAVADGITTVVATPHLFSHRAVAKDDFNAPETIREAVTAFNRELMAADIPLTVLPGCEVPLFAEIIEYVDTGRVISLNDGGRYISLEMPDTVIPPATEDIIFQLGSRGLTPIITHPERNPIFYEMPQKLTRLISLGCLSQITAASLTGGFGWRVSRFAKKLVRAGLVHLVATDAHSCTRRPPVMSQGLKKLRRLVGDSRAWEMVATLPHTILNGTG